MKRTLTRLATLLTFVLILAACGSSSEVGTSSGDVPEENGTTEGSLPLADTEDTGVTASDSGVTASAEPTEDTINPLPVPDPASAPVEVDGEHVITNEVMVDPQVTTPVELLLNPENDSELWVRFTNGDPNCTAASVTVITETPEMVQVELLVGITEDALARSCMAGEFNLRVDVALNESAVGKTLSSSQAGPPAAQLVTPDLSTDDFIGLTEAEAAAIADENIISWRTVAVDGEFFPVTEDYRPDRLNFEIEDSVITVVTLG